MWIPQHQPYRMDFAVPIRPIRRRAMGCELLVLGFIGAPHAAARPSDPGGSTRSTRRTMRRLRGAEGLATRVTWRSIERRDVVMDGAYIRLSKPGLREIEIEEDIITPPTGRAHVLHLLPDELTKVRLFIRVKHRDVAATSPAPKHDHDDSTSGNRREAMTPSPHSQGCKPGHRTYGAVDEALAYVPRGATTSSTSRPVSKKQARAVQRTASTSGHQGGLSITHVPQLHFGRTAGSSIVHGTDSAVQGVSVQSGT